MKTRLALVLLVVAASCLASCASLSVEERARRDQTRFEQQQKRFPDRLSSTEEASAAQRARRDQMLKQ